MTSASSRKLSSLSFDDITRSGISSRPAPPALTSLQNSPLPTHDVSPSRVMSHGCPVSDPHTAHSPWSALHRAARMLLVRKVSQYNHSPMAAPFPMAHEVSSTVSLSTSVLSHHALPYPLGFPALCPHTRRCLRSRPPSHHSGLSPQSPPWPPC